MKTLIKQFLLTLLFLITVRIYPQELDHVQPAHQQLVREAWNLCKLYNPNYANVEMNSWIGTTETSGPWDFTNQARVVAGAWREDDEDVIWNYSCPTIPPLLWQYTNTHFWKVENPNNPNQYTPYTLSGNCYGFPWECGPVPGSAWDRLNKYINGGWTLHKQFPNTQVDFQRWDGQGVYHLGSLGPFGIIYEGLVEGSRNLYGTGYARIVSYYNEAGQEEPFNHPYEVRLAGNKYLCYEILGRMAHCLGDMSVPAHTHLDPHPQACGEGDSYEQRMDGQYQNYTASNCGGPLVDPFFQTQYHPVYYLAFLQNQIARWFPSNDAGGWSYYTGYPFSTGNWLYNAPYWTNSIFTDYGANGITQANFETIANYCMKSAIRTTAGLFYWFLIKTNQQPLVPPTITSIVCNQHNNNFFWHENLTLTASATGTQPLYFAWSYRKCGSYNGGCQNTSPMPNGLWVSSVGNPSFTFNNSNQGQNCNQYNCYQTTPCTIQGYYPDCGQGNISYTATLTVTNSVGSYTFTYPQSIFPFTNVRPPPPPGGGGCPFIYVWNSDSTLFYTDNNLLHRSEFPENAGQDIKDLYKLKLTPGLMDDGKYAVQIGEYENDHDYFDMVKLYAVDHPEGTVIGITESNQIIMYDNSGVQSTDYATQNSNNITPYIQYYYQGKKVISGSSSDGIYAHYDSTSESRAFANAFSKIKMRNHGVRNSITPDSLALIGEIDREFNGGKTGNTGVVNIYTGKNMYTRQFAARQNMAPVIIPYSNLSDAVDHVDIIWNTDYAITYFSVVPVTYSGFDITEMPLSEAIHSIDNEDVTSTILNLDQQYVELDSADYVTLSFSPIGNPQPGMLRDYVFETDGRYTVNGLMHPMHRITGADEKISPLYKFNLYTNYPNPFNPKTQIRYEIAKNSFVKISIYNVLGQLIRELVNENKAPGSYSVEFDGTNLPSGLYLYKIQAGTFTDVKKMLLVK
jgi:hypothetical protein